MKNNKRKIIPILAVLISLIASFSLGYNIRTKDNYAKNINDNQKESIEITTADTEYNGKKPKYIFLFIGDGMSYSQLQLADYYLKETENTGLNILKLSTNGTMQNPDKTSLIPDSASTATAMATGEKTKSGNINVSEDGKKKYETITQKLKKDGYKVGIATTVNINHATPAGFSAHRESRKGYYEIGKEMLNTGFDYFAGGDFKDKNGENGDEKSLEKIAEEKGYTVADNGEEFDELGNISKEGNSSNDEKYLVIAEDREKTDAMKYSIDKRYEQENGKEESDSLSDYVKKGIDLLYDKKDKGFFMLIEGGKIDWACHKNDVASALYETIDLYNAVDEALKFYNNHKDETLIIVTGDHETGGLAIGNSSTEYDTHLENLGVQKMSCDRFDQEYVSKYIKEKTDFRDVLKDIEYVFGLKKPLIFKEEKAKEDSDDDHKHSDENSLELSKSEYERLKKAYDLTLENRKNRTKEESILYGSYKPITVEAARILAEKSGVAFTSFSHTAAPMAVFAEGVGASEFDGMYDNTELYEKLIEVIY